MIVNLSIIYRVICYTIQCILHVPYIYEYYGTIIIIDSTISEPQGTDADITVSNIVCVCFALLACVCMCVRACVHVYSL